MSFNNDYQDNWDEQLFGAESLLPFPQQGLKQQIKQRINKLLDSVGLHDPIEPALMLLKPNEEHFQWIYQRLVDDESRELMVQVLSFRALGYRRVKLPINNTHYWAAKENAKRLMTNSESIDLG